MMLGRNKLYSLLLLACTAGYLWFFYSLTGPQDAQKPVGLCFIKHATDLPCPSCGTTRSLVSLAKGNFYEALRLNPMGYIVALIMLSAPLWILADLILKNNTLFKCYYKIEQHLKKPFLAVPLIFLLLSNWIWNITKGI